MGGHHEPDCCFCFPISCGVTSIVLIQLIVVCDTIWQGYYWDTLKWNSLTIASSSVWLFLWLLTQSSRIFDSFTWRNVLMWYYLSIITIVVPVVSILQNTRLFTDKTYSEKTCEVFEDNPDYCISYYTIQTWILLVNKVLSNAYFSYVLKLHRNMRRPRYYG